LIDSALADAQAALDRGDVPWASLVARRAIAAGLEHPVLLNLAAWGCDQDGDLDGAARFLGRAMTLAPDDVAAIAAFARNMAKQGRLRRALAEFDRVVAMAPAEPLLWLDRGDALDLADATIPARAAFARAARLDPASATPPARLAVIAARLGDAAEARRLALDALAIDPDDIVAEQALAAADVLEGDLESGAARLARLLARTDLPAATEQQVAAQLGDARDGLGDRHGAWSSWARANAVAQESAPPLPRGAANPVDEADATTRALHAADPGGWPPLPAPDVPVPAFLTGAPRSGLSLLANALAGLPGAAVLEAHPTLRRAMAATGGAADVAALAEMAGRDALLARSAYWSSAWDAGIDTGAALLIDADAAKLTRLHLAARLFPQARVILLRRDPRDTLLSLLAHPFAGSAEALQATDLVAAAHHLAALAGAAEAAIAQLPLDIRIVRLEDLVGDFDGVTHALAAFLGLNWSPAVRDFAATAARRGATGAARFQHGLVNSTGRWRRYATELAPALPVLRPWIEHWGYTWQQP
jgi:Flp pilus assembly protein TadD